MLGVWGEVRGLSSIGPDGVWGEKTTKQVGGTQVGKQANRGEINTREIIQLSLETDGIPLVVTIVLHGSAVVIRMITAFNDGSLIKVL